MKNLRLAALATLLCCSLPVQGHERPVRKIVLKCPPDRQPMMWDVQRAIESSDYFASPTARREMLARAREACMNRPSSTLTFMPPVETKDAPASKVVSNDP